MIVVVTLEIHSGPFRKLMAQKDTSSKNPITFYHKLSPRKIPIAMKAFPPLMYSLRWRILLEMKAS